MFLPNVLPCWPRERKAARSPIHYQRQLAGHAGEHMKADALRASALPERHLPLPVQALRFAHCNQPEPPALDWSAEPKYLVAEPAALAADQQPHSDCTDVHRPEQRL